MNSVTAHPGNGRQRGDEADSAQVCDNQAAGATIDSVFAEALARYQAGHRTEATAGYCAVLARIPAHADSLHLLGLISVEQNDPARGITLIQRAIQLDPGRGVPEQPGAGLPLPGTA